MYYYYLYLLVCYLGCLVGVFCLTLCVGVLLDGGCWFAYCVCCGNCLLVVLIVNDLFVG